MDYIKIGDYRCNFKEQYEYNEYRFDKNAYPRIPCIVSEMQPGYYSVTQKNKEGTGFAKKTRTASTYLDA